MSPGLRVGWIVAGKSLIRRLVLVKQASDLNSSNVNQMVMHKLVETVYERQVTAARAHYRRRRDAMLAALAEHMPAGRPGPSRKAGCSCGCGCRRAATARHLLERAVKEARVAFVPGGAFFFDGRGRNTMRLSYSLPDEATIGEGIRRLASLI